jgi:hypothetical protein
MSQISKKRKFVADGVFRAELGEFFTRELAEEGYSGCEVRVTHARTEVCIHPPYEANQGSLLRFDGVDYYPCDPHPGRPR